MSEYLQFDEPDWMREIKAQDLVATGRIMGVAMLSETMNLAFRQLISTPGPHLADRQRGTESWVAWWGVFLEAMRVTQQNKELVPSPNIASMAEIADRISKLKGFAARSGVLLMATGEGTDGHRFAVSWMRDWVALPILLLEDEGYFARHQERRKPFLPLKVRLSMWATFGTLAGIIPDKPEGITEGSFYDDLVAGLGVDYSFASDTDPNCEAKRRRGKRTAHFTRIPEWLSEHTADRTKKLM